MYNTLIVNMEGDLVPTSVSLTCEQKGPRAHFLDIMEVFQEDGGGYLTLSQIYDKREWMSTLLLARYTVDSLILRQSCLKRCLSVFSFTQSIVSVCS